MRKKTLFLELCNVMESISNTRKRLEIQTILSQFFIKILLNDPESLIASLYLLTGTVYPEYENKELGIGESLLKSILCRATGLEPKSLEKRYIEVGDLGMVAMEKRVNQLFVSIGRLSVVDILGVLRKLTGVSGKSATAVKTNIILNVIKDLSSLETKYFLRLLEAKLKIGLALQTVLISLGLSFCSVGFEKEREEEQENERKKNGTKKPKEICEFEIVEPEKLEERNRKMRACFLEGLGSEIAERRCEGVNGIKEESVKDDAKKKDDFMLKVDKKSEEQNSKANKNDFMLKVDKKSEEQNSKANTRINKDYNEEEELPHFVSIDKSHKSEKYVDYVKSSFNKQPCFENLVGLIFKYGINELTLRCKIIPGVPLKPMLAQPARNLTKIFARIGDRPFISEFKYDGERVQIHNSGTETWIFSRNCENITTKYFDVSELDIHNCSYVIDGEVVAFSEDGIQTFQVLSTRKRKPSDEVSGREKQTNRISFNVSDNTDKKTSSVLFQASGNENQDTGNKHRKKIITEVCVFVFDLLYFNGRELLDEDFSTRRKILRENFREIENKFVFARGIEVTDEDSVSSFFREAINSRCEGIMVKLLDSSYKLSTRTNSWIKIKSDYIENTGDSLDLVVIGGYYGKGRRKGRYGGYLLAAYNDENEKYEAFCKIGTGFTDEALENFHAKFSEYITLNTAEFSYKTAVKPDVWFEPVFVWEIKAASFTRSPIYSVGIEEEKGLSLRFPRFIREREDKGPKDSTTTAQILKMYSDELNDPMEF